MINQRPKILLLSGGSMETDRLHGILAKYAAVELAENVPEMLRLLAGSSYSVVLCDRFFATGTWKDALSAVQTRYPALPTVVVSQTREFEEGSQEWVEVLAAGAFDLLLVPSSESAVISLLAHAIVSGEARTSKTREWKLMEKPIAGM
ncbi:MAG: hypothetical protein HY313_00820 [Acidobacteria bacterium]|nr:hypothetical protein [Acidobacteriota bacterium]